MGAAAVVRGVRGHVADGVPLPDLGADVCERGDHLAFGPRREELAAPVHLLEDESFPAEEAGAESFGEGDGHVCAAGRAEKRVLLGDDAAVPFAKIDHQHTIIFLAYFI